MLGQMRRFLAVIAVLLAVAAPAVADDNADANRLFVDAMQAWKQAEQLTVDSLEQAETRLELLQEIETNLSRIIDDHASSDLAVQLLLGPVGPLDLDGLPKLIKGAEASVAPFLVTKQILAGDIRNARIGLAQIAIHAAQTIEDADDRSRALSAIAEAQAKAGNVSEAQETFSLAVQTAQTIEDADDRSWALSAIAEAQAKAGNVSEALETAQTIERDGARSWALIAIAEAQAEAGNVSEALETAQTIERDGAHSLALSAIAEAQAKAGNVSEAQETFSLAVQTAQTIEDVFLCSIVLGEILKSSAALMPR